MIRSMTAADADDVLRIYKEGIDTGNATFNTTVPAWATWHSEHLMHSRLVAEADNELLGWAALSPVSSRVCYSGVAELSIYIASAHRGKGVGTLLMQSLVTESERNGIWTLYSSSLEENAASVKLQKKFGFREIGYREKIARLNDVWCNTIVMERRSKIAGV